MFGERLFTVTNNLTTLRIDNYFFVAVVFAINLARKLVPLTSGTMKVIARDRFVDWFLMPRALVFHSNLLADSQLFVHVSAEVAG